MATSSSAFWDDLAEDLEDPEFRAEYIRQTIRIATIDRIIDELDQARSAAGLTKAALARAIRLEPATVRRFFSAEHVNPTLGTLSEVAAALGMQITLAPFSDDVRTSLTDPLFESTADTHRLARGLVELRNTSSITG
jgi:DNA-binding phage protein